MSQRKIAFISGEYYHIYNRGNSKQQIFHDTEDYERFVSLLCLSNSIKKFKIANLSKSDRQDLYKIERGEKLVAIGAWTLMPNHFHILVTPHTEKGVSVFMQKLTTGYSMYYNQKYKRSGSLFEGKFKAEHVDTDRYLKYLYAYIHLNPLKVLNKNIDLQKILPQITLQSIESYPYSSYQDYVSEKRLWKNIISPTAFPPFFVTAMKKDLLDWIIYRQGLDKKQRIDTLIKILIK